MNEKELAEKLRHVRGEIDAVDQQLLRMLNKRAELSLEVGRIKAREIQSNAQGDADGKSNAKLGGEGGAKAVAGAIFKPEREQQVLTNLAAHNTGPLPQKHVDIIWREIFSSSRALQRPQKVAYLGPEGTFSYFAGLEYLGKSVDMCPFSHFHDLFRAVYDGRCELGVVPLENSLEGTVGQCFDLFYNFSVSIQAELLLHIKHSLLSLSKSLSDITHVFSHPQALAQCDVWLRAHLPKAQLVPAESTAAAARRALENPTYAAIGNATLAELHSFTVLASSIESSVDNWTRFVIIAPQDASALHGAKATPQAVQDGAALKPLFKKTSLLFTLIDKPGSLSSVLSAFAEYGVNMRKLESRPLRLSSGECWRYVFFADLECDLLEASYAPLVESIQSLCNSFRILGAYPAAMPLVTNREGGNSPC